MKRLVVFALAAFCVDYASGENFTPGTMDEDKLLQEYESAVLRLDLPTGGFSGTGFLIEKSSGYLLTANHVLVDESGKPLDELIATSPANPSVRMSAKVVERLKEADGDLALMQLDPKLLPNNVEALDITLRLPLRSTKVYAMGYPTIVPGEDMGFVSQLVDLVEEQPNGLLKIRQATFPGNSGGPLVDDTGCVVAICLERIGEGATVARYTPMATAKKLLFRLPLTDAIRILDDKVRSRTATPEDLAVRLHKTTGTPSNVELFSWATYMLKNAPQYSGMGALFDYPILVAYMHRGLDDLVIPLSKAFGGSTKVCAEANIHVAEREYALGHMLTASLYASTAKSDFGIAGDSNGENRAQNLETNIQLDSNNLGGASDWKKKMNLKEDSNQAFVDWEQQPRVPLDAGRISDLYNFRKVLAGQVKVGVNNGVVRLTGTVGDKDDSALAEDTIKNLPGVLSVDNEIVVRSEVPEHSDEWIAMKIRGELLVKAHVSATATKVNVKDGFVTLTGTAENPAQKDLTEAYAKDIDYVKSVKNEIVVVAPTSADNTVGEKIDDASITTQVKFTLLSHRSTSALSTKVTTKNAVVTISGVAGSDAERDFITKLAQDTRGVTSVVNEMTVKN